MGNTRLLISSSNYAKRQLNVLRRRFFWNTLYEGWFWCKDFPHLMNDASGRFHFLLHCQTLPLFAGNSLLVIQKAKLLNMSSYFWLLPQVKVWGDSAKIIILRNLIHTKLLQMTKESSMDNDRQHYIFMYVYIHCFNWISRLEIRLLSGFASV